MKLDTKTRKIVRDFIQIIEAEVLSRKPNPTLSRFSNELDTNNLVRAWARAAGFKQVGCGSTRIAFDIGNWILKFEFADRYMSCIGSNDSERAWYRIDPFGLAMSIGIPGHPKFLLMEKVDDGSPLSFDEKQELRSIEREHFDGWQCGRSYRTGKMVFYDYAYNPIM